MKEAIEDDYFFEMLIDDLPMWGYIGEVSARLLESGHEINWIIDWNLTGI